MAKTSKRGRKAPPRTRRKPRAPGTAAAPGKARDATLKQQLTESRAQQAATAAILKVIARSPSDVQPVFDAIVRSAMRLIGGNSCSVTRLVDGNLHLAAFTSTNPSTDKAYRALYPMPIEKREHVRKAIRTGTPQFVTDVPARLRSSPEKDTQKVMQARQVGSLLLAPLLREGVAIGMIHVARAETGAFSANQIGLIETFAAQAVIAIENVRLFKELEARNRDVTDALEQQTATAEILSVISSSPTSVQPVFDAIAASALRLFDGLYVAVVLVRGEKIEIAATGGAPEIVAKATSAFPIPLDRESIAGRVIVDRAVQNMPDMEDPALPELARALSRDAGVRALLGAPMLREGTPIGAIMLMREHAGEFSAKQVALLKTFADQAVIAIENVRLFNETKEALEQQRATADVLASISGSMADTQPVFERIVQNVRRLFGTRFAVLQLLHGDTVEMPAIDGDPEFPGFEKVRERYPRPLDETTVGGQAMISKQAFQLAPVIDNPAAPPGTVQFARDFGFNSVIFSPMIHEGNVIGAIGAAHPDAKPFDERQVALIKTFADQAVIAIQNARLFNETREALERQTATAEILKVIASSPSDVQPVFDAIAKSAYRLIGGFSTAVARVYGDVLHLVAFSSTGESGNEALKHAFPMPVARSKAARTATPVCISDTEALPESASALRELARTRGFRSIVIVPMLREGVATGTISVTRREPGEFSDHQVDLLKTFADQAVIAVENVRLFNETKEALEQQKASADVLGAISGSITDTKPVFDMILESCERLFEGDLVGVTLVTADGRIDLAAYHGGDYDKLKSVYPLPLSRDSGSGAAILDGAVAHYSDIEAAGVPPGVTTGCRSVGMRSIIFAPMLFESRGVGAIWVGRKFTGQFTDKQIALLRTFADQAVIAIQNARLFNETKESLERQTATAEILQVIASSPSDVQPVFDAIVRSATGLCESAYANVFRFDGEMMHWASSHGWPAELMFELTKPFPMRPDRARAAGRAILDRQAVRIEDVPADPEYDKVLAAAMRYRRILAVPLLREGRAVGAIAVGWSEAGAIRNRHEELLKTFADQAVIAIENVRLFNETKEALERQTATAEILKVISSSPTDLQPVFDAILGNATKLCDAHLGILNLYDGEEFRTGAQCGGNPEFAKWLAERGAFVPPANSALGRMIAERRPVQVPDIREAQSYRDGAPITVKMVEIGGARTFLAVPLLKEDAVIGSVGIYRPEVRPFTERQIALVKTFADQAVIAIENVRLFNETKDALERQTATAEILKVIAGSPSDVQPVFDAIAASARRLLGGQQAVVTRRVADTLHLVAFTPTTEAGDIALKKLFPTQITGQGITGKAISSRGPVSISDIEADAAYSASFKDGARARGFRSVLSVPMLREGEAIGAINVTRPEPGPFSEHQINLLKAFADQAVIAIENVRLFNETKEALEQQTATAEILQVISSSPTDTQPVFEAIVQSGLRLFPNAAVAVVLPEGNKARMVAVATHVPAQAAAWRARFPIPLAPDRLHSAAILECRLIDVPDAEAEVNGALGPGARNFLASGNRAITIAPMLCGEAAIGAISVVRAKPGPLSEKQVALLRTFAAQAVIAIENVRVFKELEARTGALTRSVEQLTALGEVGQAISSTLDLETVLKTIVARAVQLTGLDGGTIYEYDERTQEFHLRAAENMPEELAEVYRRMPIRLGEGVVGSAAARREPVQVPDIQDPGYQTRYRDLLIRQGYRAILAVPLLREDQIIGALTVNRGEPGAFAPEVVELLKTFATQSAMAIQNARLFREIAEKGKQLEVASRHKSDFLASMSHELRTPLNAILGFNEMIIGQVYGEVPADMQEPLGDIQASGKHLLRLINNVLDLAKIEAGRMELSLQDYSVHDTVESVRATLRPLAAEKGLEFLASVPNDVPLAYGDGGRISQCLMNLAGNSLKFTKAGKVEIAVECRGELLVYKVADTGIGIPPDKIGSLFTEFKQTDATIASEYGGTGLGLSISKKFVEMHGGRIWVESELGRGSAFIFEIPLRAKTP